MWAGEGGGRNGHMIIEMQHKNGGMNGVSEQEYKDIYPGASQPSRLYSLPKMHKICKDENSNKYEIPPFRPINSSIGSYNYKLAKFLSKMVTPLYLTHTLSRTRLRLLNKSKKTHHDKHFLCSYDLCSLYTNIPLDETINLAIQKIFENNSNMKISKNELKELFLMATAKNHFQFNGKMYDQIDGVAMGSPLTPALANLFLGY